MHSDRSARWDVLRSYNRKVVVQQQVAVTIWSTTAIERQYACKWNTEYELRAELEHGKASMLANSCADNRKQNDTACKPQLSC